MKFTPDFIERVAEANNILDLVSQYTQLKPAAGGYMGRCPFPDHPEKTPSFSVSESKQVFNCFGCHKHGNIYQFLMLYNGLSFPESVEYLANRAGISMPESEDPQQQKEQDEKSKKKKDFIRIHKLAALFYQEQFKRLPPEHPAKQYAIRRGLNAEILDEFKIGYAPSEWDSLVNYLKSKNVPMFLAEEARLVKARASGKTGHFDIFRDRLIFPILNVLGEPVGFGGRIILQGEPKYLNSPESLIFHKGKILYGLAHTAKYIRSEDQALVVEGYMDLVSLFKSGLKNVAATMGTALTADHGKSLGRMTKNVVVLFDGDSAGQEAAERSLPVLLSSGVHPKGLLLPDNLDPDDFVNKFGPEAFKEKIMQAPDLFSLILQQWLQGYRGEASQKVQLTDKLAPVFSAISDPRLRDLYVREASQKMGVELGWLKTAIIQQQKRGVGAQRNEQSGSVKEPEISMDLTQDLGQRIQLKGSSKAEILILGLALKNRANLEIISRQGELFWVQNEGVREILQRALSVYRQAPEKFDKLASLLTGIVDHPELLFPKEVAALTSDSGDGVNEEVQLLQDCIRRAKDECLAQEAKNISLELRHSSSPEKLERLMQIQKERLALKQKTEQKEV